MSGNYYFTWNAIAAAGNIEGIYEQSIYGKNFADACAQFESFHGPLSPDENGVCLVITGIAWQP
jgi:hypothetical protein